MTTTTPAMSATSQPSGGNVLLSRMLGCADPSQVEGLCRFFKTGPGQYGEGDRFLGIKVPATRSVVKECWREASLSDIGECLASGYHEVRLAGLLCLVQCYKRSRREEDRKRFVDFYLSHLGAANNWDLVDLSCYEILGDYLLDHDRSILYTLAREGRTIWEKRVGIVSTMQFLRHGQTADTFAIARILLHERHDLLHKAVGWLLREAGKRDLEALCAFLDEHAPTMPRTALRYAVERLEPALRSRYMAMKGGSS